MKYMTQVLINHDSAKILWHGTIQEVSIKVELNKFGADIRHPLEYHGWCEGIEWKIKDRKESRKIELGRAQQNDEMINKATAR